MHSLIVLAALVAFGCTSIPSSRIISRDDAVDLDELLARHPLAADANIRADEIGRSPASSMHLVQVRGGETPHFHAHHDLTITVLRGAGTLTLGGTAHALRAGDVAAIPREVVHHFVRSGGEPAVALVVFAPPLDAPDSVAVGGVDSPGHPR